MKKIPTQLKSIGKKWTFASFWHKYETNISCLPVYILTAIATKKWHNKREHTNVNSYVYYMLKEWVDDDDNNNINKIECEWDRKRENENQ